MFWAQLVVILGSFLWRVRGQDGGCGSDWAPHRGHCYLLVNDVATWTGAQTICKLLHSVLVEIETEDENHFIVAQMQQHRLGKAWIGLNDFVREGHFVWTSTGEPVEYTNWASGEPNDDPANPQLGDQDCGAIYSSGQWDDEYCETTHHQQFFCEREHGGSVIG